MNSCLVLCPVGAGSAVLGLSEEGAEQHLYQGMGNDVVVADDGGALAVGHMLYD